MTILMSVVFTASTRSPIRSLPDHKRVNATMVLRTTMVYHHDDLHPHHHYWCGQDDIVGRNTCCSSGATRDDFADVDSLKHILYEYGALCNHNGCDDDDDGGKRRKGHQIWKRLSLKGISLPL